MDLAEIEKNYERMSDSNFERAINNNAKGLMPEVYGIIEKEIKKRNLNPDLLKSVEAQNKEYTASDVEKYASMLRGLPCPVCGSNEQQLNGTMIHTVMSFLIITTSKSEPFVACPDCLDEKNNNAMLTSALLGWWGIPWGIIRTPIYMYKNIKSKKQNRSEEPTNSLLAYTLRNIVKIETYKDDKEALKQLISQ